MSDCVPVTWDSTIFFDSEGIIFSSTPQCPTNVGVMPSSFSWTLKKLGEKVFLYFESDSNWNVDFNLFTDTIKSRRFALSKPTMNTHTIQVFSWKFLPNNLGVGSIVFYGSVGAEPFHIYCGNNIKNTKANPSGQTWDILNGSDLPTKMQVDANMFLAIELEKAEENKTKAKYTLQEFAEKFSYTFEDWMKEHLSTLSNTVEETTHIGEVSKKYSALDGQKFLLSPGEEFVVLDTDGDMVTSKYTGESAILVLEDNAEEHFPDCFRNHPEFETTTPF